MTNDRERSATGRAPINPGAGTRSGASILISAVLALLFGGAGAWAYERFLVQPRTERPPEAATPQGGDSDNQKKLARLDDRINSLSDQYKQLQSRLETIPKPSPPPDLASIEQKVARIDELSKQVEAMGKKLDPLPQRLAQDDHKFTELDAKLDELRHEMTASLERPAASRNRGGSPTPSPGRSPAQGAEGASAAAEKGESLDAALEPGVKLFRDGRYREAYAAFRKLLQSHPDDARAWYYAALSYGLSSGEWGPEAQQMVERGVAREKAGTPPKSEIDSAFAGLTKETGKEWLDFYRRRAG